MRRAVWVMLAGCLLAGCGEGTAPTPATVTTHEATGPRPATRAARLLTTVGVTDIADAEPSGGGGESLTGRWRGHQVLVGVVPTEEAAFTEPIVRSYQVRDREVRVLDVPPYVVHRVNLGRDLWDVVVPDDDAVSRALVEALVATQLPPEETPAEQVSHADNLYGVRIERSGNELAATSVWGISCDHDGCDPAVLVRQTGTDRSYEVGTAEELQKELQTGEPVTASPFGEGTLAQPVVSLRPGAEALIGGSDGATVLPFEWVARDGTPLRVEEPRRMQAMGAVVLPDGRLLTLLTARLGEYSLWVSDGADWTTYRPVATPDGVQALGASVAPDPVVWLQTADDRVLVSDDGAAPYRELELR